MKSTTGSSKDKKKHPEAVKLERIDTAPYPSHLVYEDEEDKKNIGNYVRERIVAYLTEGTIPVVENMDELSLIFRYIKIKDEWYTLVPQMLVVGKLEASRAKRLRKERLQRKEHLKVVK